MLLNCAVVGFTLPAKTFYPDIPLSLTSTNQSLRRLTAAQVRLSDSRPLSHLCLSEALLKWMSFDFILLRQTGWRGGEAYLYWLKRQREPIST